MKTEADLLKILITSDGRGREEKLAALNEYVELKAKPMRDALESALSRDGDFRGWEKKARAALLGKETT